MLNFDEFNLVELVERSGVQLKQYKQEWRSRCPIHGGDNDTAFVVFHSDDGRWRWHCFTRSECGSGDAVDFVMRWRGYDFKNAVQYLGGEIGAPNPQELANLAAERAKRVEQSLKEQIEIAQKALEDLQSARRWMEYHENLDAFPETRDLWRARGIPDTWIDLWQLGYSPKYKAMTKAGLIVTPTLTIPIYDKGWGVLNIRHRLLNPITPNDKYRPERSGLPAHPFMCDPDVGYDCDNVLAVEGEIKSMVVYITLDSIKWQVLGIPGITCFKKIADQLKGKRVVICFDPGADIEAEQACKDSGGKMIRLPIKIDDIINDGGLDQSGLRNLIKGATKP